MTDTAAPGDARLLAGRYTIGEYIGQGGMSTVYSGTDSKLGRPVAIKVMRAGLAGDEQFRIRFRQEAQSASRLAHPNIVRVLDAGDDLIQTGDGPQRLPFIVMEYVDGENLREMTARERLSSAEACRVVDSILSALEYSHRAGIVHRDIKPANIMITRSGQVKVMDFGIARAVSETSSTMQQTTEILGTAAYFSPEQAKGEPVDARTDLYSTGVLLYELLTGDVPFRGDTAVAVAYQHVSERPTPPRERDSEVSPELDQVILHSLAKDRARRFQSASDFREALRLAASGVAPQLDALGTQHNVLFTPVEEATDSELALSRLADASSGSRRVPRPPMPWIWGAAALVAVVVGAVVFWLVALAPNAFTFASVREVPQLVNMAEAEAVATLTASDLEAVVQQEASDDIQEGHVIRTDPAMGTTVEKGTTVTIYVSNGPATVEVPDYNLMSLDEYTTALEAVGLRIGATTTMDDADSSKNTVLRVLPVPGTRVDVGSTVELTIASGKVTVPDVTGQTVAVAQPILRELHLQPIITPDDSCPQNGAVVTRQSIVGPQPQGSSVEIFYCIG